MSLIYDMKKSRVREAYELIAPSEVKTRIEAAADRPQFDRAYSRLMGKAYQQSLFED
jgi:hypothetical protein